MHAYIYKYTARDEVNTPILYLTTMGQEEDRNSATISAGEVPGDRTGEDEVELARMGYKQELKCVISPGSSPRSDSDCV